MQKREENVTARLSGNALQPLSGVTVSVVDDATGLPAALYSDDGVTLITAPLVTDASGYFGYYAADGKYTETLTGSRLSSPVTRKIILEDPDDNPAATRAQLAAAGGGALVKTMNSGTGAVLRTIEDKARDTIDAADYIAAPGVSDALDKAGILAAANEASARGGGIVPVRKPIGLFNLSDVPPPITSMLLDERYADSGWVFFHSEGDDAQMGLRGRASALGEGPSLVLQNLATTGNRNASTVHWYGPSNAPVVASFEHWGYNADGTWYAGREWLGKGSIDTGFRARYRYGGDGTMIFNPNGDAASFKNSPSVAFAADRLYVWNAPLQTGYANSGKYLMSLRSGALELNVELQLYGANPAIRLQDAAGANKCSIIGGFPSASQTQFYDHDAGKAFLTLTSGVGAQLGGVGLAFTAVTAASAPNGYLFQDSADGKLKFKDAGGVVNLLY